MFDLGEGSATVEQAAATRLACSRLGDTSVPLKGSPASACHSSTHTPSSPKEPDCPRSTSTSTTLCLHQTPNRGLTLKPCLAAEPPSTSPASATARALATLPTSSNGMSSNASPPPIVVVSVVPVAASSPHTSLPAVPLRSFLEPSARCFASLGRLCAPPPTSAASSPLPHEPRSSRI